MVLSRLLDDEDSTHLVAPPYDAVDQQWIDLIDLSFGYLPACVIMYVRVQDELRKEEEAGQKAVFEWDDDLPGYVSLSVHAPRFSYIWWCGQWAIYPSILCHSTASPSLQRRPVLLHSMRAPLCGPGHAGRAHPEQATQAEVRAMIAIGAVVEVDVLWRNRNSRCRPANPDRLKDVAQEQYTQREAEFAAGMTKEILPPAHGGSSVSTMVN